MTIAPLAGRLPSTAHLRGVTYDASAAQTWIQWLSQEEKALFTSFGAEKRQREFLAGRAAARELLAEVLDRKPAQVPLRRAADEGVDVEEGDWQVSIAHSGSHALAGCARHRIGVDLEHIEPRDPNVAQFLLHPDEQGLLDTLPYEKNTALLLCWTLKEAVLKARRTGFRTSPKTIHLTVEAENDEATATVVGGERWILRFAELDGYWGAVALPRS